MDNTAIMFTAMRLAQLVTAVVAVPESAAAQSVAKAVRSGLH